MDNLMEFYESKIMKVQNTGFKWDNFHPNTFPHQKHTCSWALNEVYWSDSVQYLKEYDYKRSVPTLFDLVEV